MAAPVYVICSYRVANGNESEFQKLLSRHWPLLRELGLATRKRPRHFRGEEQERGPIFFEIFEWVDEDAHKLASQHPDLMAIWERMDKLCEARHGRPNMEFPHATEIEVLGNA
ncbi:MAG TPA: hypothetical protein VMR50_15130 [Myxococcota bacterium]|nr:hypothetical protein [Myxococcota bacterium]